MVTRVKRHRVLLGLDLFMGVVAAVFGLILIAGQAEPVLQMKPDVLDGTPFGSFLVPGILLAVAVGGSYLVAAAGLLRGESWGVVASLIAGCVMFGWIAGELILLGWVAPLFLQPFTAGYALLTIVEAWREGSGRRLLA